MIDDWRGKHWQTAADFLKHFLEKEGKKLVLNKKQIAEIRPAVDRMARSVIRDNLMRFADCGGIIKDGSKIDITQPVRWLSTNPFLSTFDLLAHPFTYEVRQTDEMMFYTYNGAVLKIAGTATNVRYIDQGLSFDVVVTITIEDDYDFYATTFGIRNCAPSYAAGNFLQTIIGYKRFDSTGSYDGCYQLEIQITPQP